MGMAGFHILDPDLARAECRTLTVFDSARLPAGTYALTESYCDDPGCDCRRVLINVIEAESQEQVATINYSFEPPEPPFDDEGQGFLDPINPQSEHAPTVLDLFTDVVLKDPAYRQRLVRHYELFKQAVDDPDHPRHSRVRSAAHDDPDFSPAFSRRAPYRREERKIGPNEKCPCGSGKKYKRCCRRR